MVFYSYTQFLQYNFSLCLFFLHIIIFLRRRWWWCVLQFSHEEKKMDAHIIIRYIYTHRSSQYIQQFQVTIATIELRLRLELLNQFYFESEREIER